MFYLGKKYLYRAEAGEAGSEGGGGEAETGDNNDAALEVEAEAKKMGWTPKEEFKGDPDKWRDAADFVDRGKNMLPIVKKTVERQERKIQELERTIREFAEHNSKADQRAMDRALRELKTRQVNAVATGDTEAFLQIDKEMADLHKEAQSAPKVPQADDVHPDYPEWEAKNKWFVNDAEASAFAESYGANLRSKGDKSQGLDFLDKVTAAVKKAFPEKFSNPRRENAPSVESSSAPAKKGGKSYADLPAEAKAACDRFVKNSGGKFTRESYCKTFFEEE